MATGILGQSAPAAATNTTVYTVPSGKVASFSVSIVNRGSSQMAIRLAISATATPTNSEWIEYDAILAPRDVLERGGLVAQAGENIVVYADTASASVSVYGFEE